MTLRLPNPFGAPLIDPSTLPAPEVSCLRPLDWVKDIELGNAVVLCEPGDQKPLVKAENTNVRIAETIDVALASEIQGHVTLDPSSFAWPHVVAHICWGVGSQTFNAWVDVQTGTHFSVVAQMVRVVVSYELCVPPWEKSRQLAAGSRQCEEGCLPTFKVSGGLGYGCSKRIQLTQLAMAEKPGDKCTLAIPPFAEAFHVMAVGDGKLDVRILGFGGQLGPVVHNPKIGDLIPLFGGAEFVEVTNTGEEPLLAFLVFILGL